MYERVSSEDGRKGGERLYLPPVVHHEDVATNRQLHLTGIVQSETDVTSVAVQIHQGRYLRPANQHNGFPMATGEQGMKGK